MTASSWVERNHGPSQSPTGGPDRTAGPLHPPDAPFDRRAFVRDNHLEEHIAAIVANAPPLPAEGVAMLKQLNAPIRWVRRKGEAA